MRTRMRAQIRPSTELAPAVNDLPDNECSFFLMNNSLDSLLVVNVRHVSLVG